MGREVNPVAGPVKRWGLVLAVVVALAQMALVSAASAAPVRIMPLGDSLTAGIATDPNDAAYRDSLEDRLVAGGYSFDFVGSQNKGPATLADKDNEGHGGFTIDDIKASVNGWLSASAPDYVLLMIGTNDIRQSVDLPNMSNRLAALLDQMITARPGTWIIVGTIPTQTDLPSGGAQMQALLTYNNAIPNIVGTRSSQGKRISWVNVYGAVAPSDIADGDHPTPAGHTKIAGVFYGGIQGVLAPPLTAPTSTSPPTTASPATSSPTTTTPGATTTAPTTTAPPGGGATYLSDLNPTSASNGYGPYERDKANGGAAAGDGHPLGLADGVTYTKGLGVHAPSSLTYALGGSYSSFLATVGIDAEVQPDGSVSFQVFTDGTKVYDSGKLTWASGPRAVNVSVAGKSTLQLVVTDGGDGTAYDHADWALARVTTSGGGATTTTPTTAPPGPTTTAATTTTPPTGGTTYLSDLNPTSASNGYGPYERDKANGGAAAGDGHPLGLANGVTYTKGLGVHANSSLTYALGGSYSSFQATVGVDAEVAPDGSVVFQVFVDGAKVYDSGKLTWASGVRTVNVNVAGKSTLQLVVTDSGDGTSYDHADWALARVLS